MHVGITDLRWRGKRSRHSPRMRTCNFTYLERGSLECVSQHHQWYPFSAWMLLPLYDMNTVTNKHFILLKAIESLLILNNNRFRFVWENIRMHLHWYHQSISSSQLKFVLILERTLLSFLMINSTVYDPRIIRSYQQLCHLLNYNHWVAPLAHKIASATVNRRNLYGFGQK